MKKLAWLAPGILALALLSYQLVGGSEGTSAQDDGVCPPVFPTTFTGTVAICGEPAADGTLISAWGIYGVRWATGTTAGGSYAMDVPDVLPVEPPCFPGGTISFTCDGMPAAETGEATGGLVHLDLTCCPEVPSVDIDIKPGSDPNSINVKSRGVIPVAILTTADFDALTVDADTVEFEGACTANHPGIEDVDHDGDLDLLLRFRTRETNLVPGQTEGCLTGETYYGMPIQGCDTVRILGGYDD